MGSSLKNKNDINYTIPSLNDEGGNAYIIGNNLTKEKIGYKVGKSVECGVQTGKYVSGATAINFAINSASKVGQFSSQAVQLTSQAAKYGYQASQISAQAAQVAQQASSYSKFLNFFTGTGTDYQSKQLL